MNQFRMCFGLGIAMTSIFGGCSSTPTSSTITGKIDQSSFVTPVEQITIVSERGQTVVPVDATTGAFKLVLKKGATYQFMLSPDGKSTPIVLRSSATQLETTVHVKSGGAVIDMGAVHSWRGLQRMNPSGIISAPSFAKTDAAAVCQDEDEDEDDDDHECGDRHGHDDDNDIAGRVPAAPTPAATTPITLRDSLGLPAFNVSSEVGCGDDDDDDDDDEDGDHDGDHDHDAH